MYNGWVVLVVDVGVCVEVDFILVFGVCFDLMLWLED